MEFTSSELEEFKTESIELLDEAERHLLMLEKGGDLAKMYATVFRVFHSLKGGAGMLGLQTLQSHMHQLENQYQECKEVVAFPPALSTYFLSGIDVARKLIAGQNVSFDYSAFRLDPSPASPASPPQIAAIESLGDGARVMLIDDEPEIIEILKDVLTHVGFDPTGFTSPQEAIAQVKHLKPEAVLTDFRMPTLTGLDVLKQISSIDPDIPIVYVSGYLSKEVVIQSLGYGIFGTLEKPFEPGEVIAICKNAVERYRMVRLLNHTINMIYYQFSDLDQYLKGKGAEETRDQMHSQLKSLIEAKRKLKFLRKSAHQKSAS